MFIYLGIWIFTVLIVIVGDKIRAKNDEVCSSLKSFSTYSIWISCIILVVFVSCRTNETASDTYVYYQFFCNPYKGFAEIGYYYLNVWVRTFTDSFNVFLGVCSVISIVPVFYVISKLEGEKWIYVFLYQSLLLYTFNFAIIRQAMAMSLLTLGVFLLLTKKDPKSYIYFAVCFLLAFSFHRISLIAIPLLFVKNLKVEKKQIVILGILGIITIIFHDFILKFVFNTFFPDKAEMYLSNLNNDFGLIPFIIFIISHLILESSKLNISSAVKRYCCNINIYFLLITVFLFWFPSYGRILQFGYLNVMIAVGECYDKMSKKGRCLCLLFFSSLYIYLLTRNPYNIIPYHSIF